MVNCFFTRIAIPSLAEPTGLLISRVCELLHAESHKREFQKRDATTVALAIGLSDKTGIKNVAISKCRRKSVVRNTSAGLRKVPQAIGKLQEFRVVAADSELV